MATGDQIRFHTTATHSVRDREMTPIALTAEGEAGSPTARHVRRGEHGIEFQTEGWYEVLLRVDWDPSAIEGTRFSHTKIPDQEPLHSEAIDAGVLADISEGRQLLRGNSLFGPDRTTCLLLEVWQNSGGPVDVKYAELVVRELEVPWPTQGR